MKVVLNLWGGNIDFVFDFPSRVFVGDLFILENFIDRDMLLSKKIKADDIEDILDDSDYVCQDIWWGKKDNEIVQSIYLVKESEFIK